MIFKIPNDIKFSYYYRKLNILSLIFIILSILVLLFKGLNLGVDFKGGTLIEIRAENSVVDIADIRQSLLKMQLGDINVKKFGNENDYLVQIEITNPEDENYIKNEAKKGPNIDSNRSAEFLERSKMRSRNRCEKTDACPEPSPGSAGRAGRPF